METRTLHCSLSRDGTCHYSDRKCPSVVISIHKADSEGTQYSHPSYSARARAGTRVQWHSPGARAANLILGVLRCQSVARNRIPSQTLRETIFISPLQWFPSVWPLVLKQNFVVAAFISKLIDLQGDPVDWSPPIRLRFCSMSADPPLTSWPKTCNKIFLK
jgi:hypothetical protein